jgi:hypothetical protein
MVRVVLRYDLVVPANYRCYMCSWVKAFDALPTRDEAEKVVRAKHPGAFDIEFRALDDDEDSSDFEFMEKIG